MNSNRLDELRIDARDKVRPKRPIWTIIFTVLILTVVALYFALPKEGDDRRVKGKQSPSTAASAVSSTNAAAPRIASTNQPVQAPPPSDGVVLTTSGYIVNRERIELSPRFMGVVKWIGVKKGDAVTNSQVVVLLDDSEYRARKFETEGRLSNAKISIAKAELNFQRVNKLALDKVESVERQDEARLLLESAKASQKEIEGQLQLIDTYLDWCVIRSPINGVVLEKLVDPNELVVPQSFGGTRGPSTALISVADPKDLQIEIDLNESDLAKIFPNQKCRVAPEAYSDKSYEGYVAEIAPEANRQKGTLQIKVQVLNPDRYLTPELSAKVDFLTDKSNITSAK